VVKAIVFYSNRPSI